MARILTAPGRVLEEGSLLSDSYGDMYRYQQGNNVMTCVPSLPQLRIVRQELTQVYE